MMLFMVTIIDKTFHGTTGFPKQSHLHQVLRGCLNWAFQCEMICVFMLADISLVRFWVRNTRRNTTSCSWGQVIPSLVLNSIFINVFSHFYLLDSLNCLEYTLIVSWVIYQYHIFLWTKRIQFIFKLVYLRFYSWILCWPWWSIKVWLVYQ